ncbi:MAG: nitronate monooxygenase [Bacteroidetes bacterium]|nr:nitronate monooxygenase [Bacteroidota bacterium]
MTTRLTQLLGIEHPIIQGGMIWCSGWELAAAVSNTGGLGTLGSGSMYPDELRAQLAALRSATDRPFAVNIPMLYPNIEEHLQSCIDFDVPVVITSAGNPKLHTAWLKERGRTVLHVVASSAFAVKAEAAGVDAVIAEGFEAGGHNGRDETTTMVLVPAVVDAVSIPVVAAGGIADGRSMAAALMLGAEGVQMGSRFVATPEASAHEAFKGEVLSAGEGSTQLTLKELAPVRLLKNPFYAEVAAAYARGAQAEELAALLGRGRAKKGMREGDLVDGELEIGQVAARINELKPAADVVRETAQMCEALLRRGT